MFMSEKKSAHTYTHTSGTQTPAFYIKFVSQLFDYVLEHRLLSKLLLTLTDCSYKMIIIKMNKKTKNNGQK